MPDQHRDFFASQPFLAAAVRDASGRTWSTLLLPSDESFADDSCSKKERGGAWVATPPDPATLTLTARVTRGDALEDHWGSPDELNQDVGLMGIEFGTKRRNRVNGRITAVHKANKKRTLTFSADQSFGNCPQYISSRQWQWRPRYPTAGGRIPKRNPIQGLELSPSQARRIQSADTIFIATGYRGDVGDDNSFGNDASHRGGPPGFLRVLNSTTLLLPDYGGNNFTTRSTTCSLTRAWAYLCQDLRRGRCFSCRGQPKW
jgi:hypothetical protein